MITRAKPFNLLTRLIEQMRFRFKNSILEFNYVHLTFGINYAKYTNKLLIL